MVASGTRRFLNFTSLGAQERKRNIVADLPINYGKPPAYRYYKGEPGKDIAAVSREELRAAIRKCHQTLWEGGKRSPIVAFGEFCKIIFVKIRDEMDRTRPKGQPYDFQRGTDDTDEGPTRMVELFKKASVSRAPISTPRVSPSWNYSWAVLLWFLSSEAMKVSLKQQFFNSNRLIFHHNRII